MDARQLDHEDELAPFRERFVVADPDLIYLDGNSLGRMPKDASRRLNKLTEEEWGAGLVRGWSDWFGMPERIGAKIAQIIGARADEVIVSDSTTVNLYKLVRSVLDSDPSRRVVVTDDLNFPSDIYAISGAVRGQGTAGLGSEPRITRTNANDPRCLGETRIINSPDGITLPIELIDEAIDASTALLTLSHTSFKSAYVHEMNAVTELAHAKGIPVLWDLSHSVGAVPVDLNACRADLAIGCTYKYLNGGPGAPAFLYIRRDLQEKLSSPIWGWFGQTNPFAFELEYQGATGLRKFLVGTPPVLSMAAIETGVDLVMEAGMDRIRAKSVRQTEFLKQLWEERLRPLGLSMKSPIDPARRGAHISFGHPEALRIDKALIEEMKVVPDFRAPDNLRFGLSPLYTSFQEIEEGLERLRIVIKEKRYKHFDAAPPTVT